MTTATPTYPTIGHELAAKLHRSQIRRGARAKRPARRKAKRPPSKPRTDPRVTAFERQLEGTVIGRQVLQLVEQSAKARLAEDAAECGLEIAESAARKLRERFCAVATTRTAEAYCQSTNLQVQLLSAEHELRRWRGEYARHRAERERLEAEVQHLAGYL